MKRHGILNSEISSLLSSLGHTDTIVIADCGLPIPDNVKRIDLALKQGTPGFIETLETVSDDMAIEKMTLANEIKMKNSNLQVNVEQLAEQEIEYISHEELKEKCKEAKAVIRTGEATPFANVILQAGVIF
ncbi:D-ribose pyranase [Halalkalibacillus sediminis]|uniref:D-ribose pyranase n=1 Tax=Halalkalibacillus sediminis TaxID=2018042 RepID=A0A2I0QUB6_9BACI|nr:D-ribose pyranase [Halalkalibacillus sediminis]PKR77927.1 D-ribose pyranase [Halalkalibacillus sediminis]